MMESEFEPSTFESYHANIIEITLCSDLIFVNWQMYSILIGFLVFLNVISALCSLFIVGTYIAWPELKSRARELLVLVSMANILLNISIGYSALMNHTDSKVQCAIQGTMMSFSLNYVLCWNLLLILFIGHIIFSPRLIKITRAIKVMRHVVTFTASLLAATLPLMKDLKQGRLIPFLGRPYGVLTYLDANLTRLDSNWCWYNPHASGYSYNSTEEWHKESARNIMLSGSAFQLTLVIAGFLCVLVILTVFLTYKYRGNQIDKSDSIVATSLIHRVSSATAGVNAREDSAVPCDFLLKQVKSVLYKMSIVAISYFSATCFSLWRTWFFINNVEVKNKCIDDARLLLAMSFALSIQGIVHFLAFCVWSPQVRLQLRSRLHNRRFVGSLITNNNSSVRTSVS